MSVKDVKTYYNEINANYREMIDAIHELEEEASKGVVSPERLEQMRASVEPIKTNWQRINYIMYLLNLPNRPKKKKRYEQLNPSTFSDKATLEGVLKENNENIKKINNK